MRHIRGNQVVGNDVGKEVEPEQRNLAEDAAFVRNASGQHVVEGGNAVGRHKQQALAVELVHVADFPAGVEVEFRKVCL